MVFQGGRSKEKARETEMRTLGNWEEPVTVAVLSSSLRFGRLLLRVPV